MTPVAPIVIANQGGKALADGARPKDRDALVGWYSATDLVQIGPQVLEAMALACTPRRAAARLDRRRMTHISRRVMMDGHFRVQPLDRWVSGQPADDDGLPGVDPDQGPGLALRAAT